MYMSAEETIRATVGARTLVFKSQVRAACRTLTQQGKGSLRSQPVNKGGPARLGEI